MTSLYLLTRDQQLVDVCREIIASHLNESIELVACHSLPTEKKDDLFFIDISSINFDGLESVNYDPASTVLFVARQELMRYADTLLQTRCRVMIKPASAVRVEMIMRQCLERNCARPSNREPAHDDALLQSVLESNMRLQVYDQDRNNFLAHAMHDFRTPLTSLEGYAGLLVDKQLGEISPTQAVVLERMQHSIRRLTYLADGMFHLSLGKNALRPLRLKPENIEKCIEQAVHEMSGAFEDKRIELKTDISSPLYTLSFERSQIEQVFVNLLDNAQKFSPRLGSISIRAYPYFWDRRKEKLPVADGIADRREARQYGTNSFRINITDSGPGISEDSLAHIFEEYRSILRSDERCGAGLGLAICRLIVERHRGAIWATSTDKGATFSIVLPSKCIPAAATQWVSNQARGAVRAPEVKVSSTRAFS